MKHRCVLRTAHSGAHMFIWSAVTFRLPGECPAVKPPKVKPPKEAK